MESNVILESRDRVLANKGLFGRFKSFLYPDELAEEIAKDLKERGLEEEAKKYFEEIENLKRKREESEKEYKFWKEYRKEKLKNEILSILPEVKLEEEKKLGFIPTYHVTLSDGYLDKLKTYTEDEVYFALKTLEKQTTGKNRKKVKAIRKEVERRSGGGRKKKIAFSILASGLMIGAAAGGWYWYTHKDTDNDGISDYLETHKYHTDPNNPDTDNDGLNDSFEILNGLNPLKPNPNIAYLLSNGFSLDQAKIVLPLDSDGVMQNNDKELIDYFNSLPANYKNNSKVLQLLSSIVSDGKVTSDELSAFKDWDADGINNLDEVNKYHTDPNKLNPVLAYLIKEKKSDEYALFKPLDSDGVMQNNDKELIDYFNSLPANYKNNSKVLQLLSSIVSDGKVTSDELSAFKDWDADGINNLDEVNKYHTDPNNPDTDNDGLNDSFEILNGLNPLKPNPNIAYLLSNGFSLDQAKIVLPLDSDGVMQNNDKNFDKLLLDYKELLILSTLKSYLAKQASDGMITSDELSKSDNFAYLVKQMYEDINAEERAKDKISDTDYAANLGLKLNFDAERATEATAKAIAEYAVAVKDEKLPEQIKALQLLTEGTQDKTYGSKLVDFSPIVFHSVDGKDVVLVVDKPRDTWLLARHMKALEDNGYDVLNNPKAFEGLNAQVIANAWSIFDAKYGISYIEKTHNNRVIKPTDADVEQLMLLQWQLYDKARQGKYYNKDFPWWDSDKLDKLYADKNTRRQALLFLWYLPSATWNMEKQEIVVGMKGAETALNQAFEEYKKISELYPDGKLYNEFFGDVDLRWYYYDWIGDRGAHELSNTVKQYVGLDWKTLAKIIRDHPLDYWNYLKDYDGIDQYLTKNWQYWDLVKAIASYERWNVGEKGGIEEMGINFIIPDTLKMFGYPIAHIHIEPTPKGAGPYEWAISLPDYLVGNLESNFGKDSIVFGPGNIFSLYSCKSGLTKDGIKEVFSGVGEYVKGCTLLYLDLPVYLMKTS